MTQIEIMPDSLFLTTDNRDELLELIPWLMKNFDRMENREQRAVTLFEYRELTPPPTAKEPA